ncbi:hypothetical protein [Haloferula sp. BvORR071]|uniref:hypothetical protein n=1 Tax=Haloferula sp. BvORR071 TaxID=1396141 RepID=UPI00054EFB93|nr:hypothetical protein [Haloferula sp. BvORR071]
MKTIVALLTVIALASCEKKAETAAAAKASAAPPSAALSKVLGTAPAAAPQAIHNVRTSAKPGDTITISGKIMGNISPFVAGRAAFVLGDPEVIQACNEMPGDKCETPWDACCDTPEKKKQGTATIQVVDAEGRTLKEPLEGVGGLEKLAKVTVTGTVAAESSADLLLVNATAIQAGK